MRRTAFAAAILSLLSVATAAAQSFPQTLPDHTVVGRLGTGSSSGPWQAIPFNALAIQLFNSGAHTVLCNATATPAAPIGCSTLPSGLTIPGVTMSVALSPSSGTVGAATANLWNTGTWSGSINSATLPEYAVGYALPLNLVNVSSDNLNAAAPASNTSDVAALLCNHSFGGSNTVGSRSCIDANLTLTATTANASTSPYNGYYNVIVATSTTGINDGGTSGTPSGQLFGISTQISLTSGATYWASVHGGGEYDLTVASGASVADKIGAEYALLANDAEQGSVIDTALLFSNRGSTTWKHLFQIGLPSGGNFPVSTDIMSAPQTGSMTNGIDLSNITFSGCAFKTSVFCASITNLTFSGAIVAEGSSGGFQAEDRSADGTYSLFYRSSDVSYLWDNAAGNVLSYTTSGVVGLGVNKTDYAEISGGSSGATITTNGGTLTLTAGGSGSPSLIFNGSPGSASKYVCTDSSNNIVVQSGAC